MWPVCSRRQNYEDTGRPAVSIPAGFDHPYAHPLDKLPTKGIRNAWD